MGQSPPVIHQADYLVSDVKSDKDSSDFGSDTALDEPGTITIKDEEDEDVDEEKEVEKNDKEDKEDTIHEKYQYDCHYIAIFCF